MTHIDVYTRRLLSIHGSPSLEACHTAAALDKVVRCTGTKALKDCIYHSDRGTQYTSEAVKRKVRELGMRQSMCTLAQENAYAERVQGTIKNEYLEYEALTKANYRRILARIMWLYNNERPHTSLGNMTPVQYEKHIQSIPENERPMLTVYKWQNPLLTTEIIKTTSTNQKSTEINYL
ncbi:MAG: transposase [Bacteroidota bacterium]